MNEQVIRDFKRPAAATVKKFRDLDVSTVYEGKGKTGLMNREIKPIEGGMKLLGPALTVLLPAGDNLMEHKALTFAKPGDVLVVAIRGGGGATWGDLFTTQAIAMGLAGVVTEGAVRDVTFIRKAKFPCFSKAISSEGTTKKGPGSVNVPVSCGGVVVNPGDIILGDDDGVVVIGREEADFAAQKAQERMKNEELMTKQLRAGKTTYELLGLDQAYQQLGIKETTRSRAE